MRAALLTVILILGVSGLSESAVTQTKWLISGGGAHSSAGNVAMSSNVGDVIAGHSIGGPTDLWHGFYAPDLTQVVDVDGPRVSLVSFLDTVNPNPARGSTSITFGNAVDQAVSLEIYDVAGRLVRTLHRSPTHAGVFKLPWDLRSNAGVSVGTGIYFVRMSAGMFHQTVRMVVIR